MKQRSRIIKPEFFQNRKLAEMSAHHRLLFIGLWTIADRSGKLQDDPDLIKAMVFPFENIDIGALLEDLSNSGFIERYNGGEYNCIIIPKFLIHQNIHKHEAKSTLPNRAMSVDVPEMPVDVDTHLPSVHSRSRRRSNSNSRSRSKDQGIPYGEIISHLNHLTGLNFRPTSKKSQENIRARWREGYRLEDFLYVNQVKSEEWLSGDMEKHLNPGTLYCVSYFEKYRNQRRIPRQYSEKTNKALIAAAKYLKQEGVQIENTGQIQISSGDA